MEGRGRLETRVELEEADRHQDETVRADATSEDFVQVALKEELLEDENQVLHAWKALHVRLQTANNNLKIH